MVFWYTLFYFLLLLAFNILLFTSSDFSTLTKSSNLPSFLVRLFFFFDLSLLLGFLITYLLLEYITRKFHPVVTEFTYAKQTRLVRIVTFHSKPLKGLLISVDLMHISLAMLWTAAVSEEE